MKDKYEDIRFGGTCPTCHQVFTREAMDKLEQQNAILREALGFYSTLKYVSDDMKAEPYKFGQRARAALKECDND